MRLSRHFSYLRPHISQFLNSCKRDRKNVFVIMRYKQADHYIEIENAIKTSLNRRGLNAHLAKDHQFLPNNLWDNICVYMLACDFGIVVFEEIDNRDFNPNISIEIGFMLALGKECLLLKDKRMPKMPTDICGHLYRDFDTYNITETVSNQIASWVRDLRTRGLL